MNLGEALDLIDFAMQEEKVDRAAVRTLVDDIRKAMGHPLVEMLLYRVS